MGTFQKATSYQIIHLTGTVAGLAANNNVYTVPVGRFAWWVYFRSSLQFVADKTEFQVSSGTIGDTNLWPSNIVTMDLNHFYNEDNLLLGTGVTPDGKMRHWNAGNILKLDNQSASSNHYEAMFMEFKPPGA